MAAYIPIVISRFPVKFWWFLSKGYKPHGWQILFHFGGEQDALPRFRHLVAGRRGGKTLSAAWEVLFYCLHPAEFHRDSRGLDSDEPLWVWCLAKDYKLGRPQLLTFIKIMNQAGLVKDVDYKYNKTEKVIEFKESGTLLEFKSADDPQSLRGAGLHILWMDEAAHIPSKEAYGVVRPGLSDQLGSVITTTTPMGKNWLWAEFFSGKAMDDKKQLRIEYTTLDSPYLDKEEVEYARESMHPAHFKQEYMASFDAFQGVELQGEWLHYYSVGISEHGDDIRLPKSKDGKLPMRTYMGIDPAISLSDDADHFAMALIGVTLDNSQAFLLDSFKGRLAFPDQLDKIKEWFLKYRPDLIGIEINAYQRALLQMSARMEGMPPVVPVISKSRKSERILGMSPLFKIGKIRIHRQHVDFISEWLNYSSSLKNPEDDLLDAVEIALGVAGILLPSMPMASHFTDRAPNSVEEEALMSIRAAQARNKKGVPRVDEELGSDY